MTDATLDLDLLQEFRSQLRSADAVQAFDILVSFGRSSPSYRLEARRKGYISDVRFYLGSDQPFAFIVNPEHLLFYMRRPALRLQPSLGVESTSGLALELTAAGEMKGRLQTAADAEWIIERILKQFASVSSPRKRGIPGGITDSDVREAMRDLDAGGVEHGFGASRLWDVLGEGGRLYPPKALIGVAARRVAGHVLGPKDFSGGEESKCHQILSELGFELVPKGDRSAHQERIDRALEYKLLERTDIGPTTREQLVQCRRGQGLFRWRVAALERQGCRVTGVSELEHLRASHIKPWRECNDKEKLDGSNGLLLAPHIDHLFDRGFISFLDDGRLIVSERLDSSVVRSWAVKLGDKVVARPFTADQSRYLAWHREKVLIGGDRR